MLLDASDLKTELYITEQHTSKIVLFLSSRELDDSISNMWNRTNLPIVVHGMFLASFATEMQ